MTNGFRKPSKATVIKEQSELIEAQATYIQFLLQTIVDHTTNSSNKTSE